ncbi:hypothetical protein BpHYR1_004495 [Brachionus plicatilis]|uniref:Uncharacterized protein n=1 Tax=Brachionus plicatilis TaxID=10195 RepID=A0A3M7T9E1_BRAPC|nr:hypothetical protein BpHYR1_004495 [Brachionus plicatilis]
MLWQILVVRTDKAVDQLEEHFGPGPLKLFKRKMQDNLLPKSDSDYQLKNVRHHFDQYLIMIQISILKIQSKEL